jgi:hypothetical protein
MYVPYCTYVHACTQLPIVDMTETKNHLDTVTVGISEPCPDTVVDAGHITVEVLFIEI